jgi:hypothetical protein
VKKAVQARPLEGYRLWLTFADGVEGEVDLSDLAGRGVFQAWSNPEIFRAVEVDKSGALTWPGEIDLCPDALYLRLTGKAAEDIFPALKHNTLVDA